MARAVFTGLLTVLLAAGIADPTAAVPARIVSINLCADELLLTLADPSQIAALSVYATDPTLSYVADQAAAFRHDAGEAETVVDLKPDLVLAGSFTKRDTRDILGRLGYRVELLPPARSIDEAIAQIRTVAAIVGHADRGEVLIARVEDARRRAEAAAAALPQRPSAAIYQRRGYVTGGSTLTGDLLSTAGFANAGAPLAGKTGGFVPLERLIAAPPDMIVVTASVKRAEDQGTALLAHPALAALYPPDRRIVLPEKLTVCGGPSLPDALDWLSQQARRVQPAP